MDSRRKKNLRENEPIDLPSCSSVFFFVLLSYVRIPTRRSSRKIPRRIEAESTKQGSEGEGKHEAPMKSSTRFFPFSRRISKRYKLYLFRRNAGGGKGTSERKHGEWSAKKRVSRRKGKIFFPSPRDTEVDYRFVTEWLFTQEASSWLNTRVMAEH